MDQITINHHQAQTLIEALQDNIDGEDVMITKQGDSSIVVAFSLKTIEITTAGTAIEDDE